MGRAPYGLAVGADGRAATGPVTGGEYRGGGMGIALSPDGAHAYVGVNVPGGTGVLEVVDTARREVTAVVPVGRRPFDVDVSPDGAEIYATGHDSFDVTVVAAGTLRPRRIEVAPYGTEGGLASWLKPHYTAVRPSDGKLLLPFEGERLAVIITGAGRTASCGSGARGPGPAARADRGEGGGVQGGGGAVVGQGAAREGVPLVGVLVLDVEPDPFPAHRGGAQRERAGDDADLVGHGAARTREHLVLPLLSVRFGHEVQVSSIVVSIFFSGSVTVSS